MNNSSYDLAIAYRIYPKVSKTPLVFTDNKYKLAELCLSSFRKCLGNLKFKMWVLLDACPPEYKDLFKKYFASKDLEFIELNGIGDGGTLGLQLKILSEQNISEIVYLAEDDYFYLNTPFEEMINFLQENKDVDFVSPYDHLDYYITDLHAHKYKMKIFGNKHWRTANSTCHTFITTKDNLIDTKNIFNKYAMGSLDSSNWLSLTKAKIFNPLEIYKFYLKRDKEWLFEFVKRAWIYNWNQIVFGKKWNLWVPIPSIATHLEKIGLAPTINWEIVIQKEIEEIEAKLNNLNRS